MCEKCNENTNDYVTRGERDEKEYYCKECAIELGIMWTINKFINLILICNNNLLLFVLKVQNLTE